MKRRKFIVAAAAWPLARAVVAQTAPKRVGILMSTTETDPREARSVRNLLQALADLGWAEGQNVEFSYGWGATHKMGGVRGRWWLSIPMCFL